MNKQNSIFFIILIVVLIGGGFFLYKELNKNTTPATTSETPLGESTTEVLQDETQSSGTTPAVTTKLAEPKITKKMDKDITTLSVEVLKQGTGDVVSKNGDRLTMNYTGSLLNGTKFDSNVDPAFGHVSPFDFVIGKGMVIRGWEEGLLGMKVGEKRLLTIPAAMAYGPMSPSPLIPANSALVFEVELLKIN